ncbi:keratin, type I cytoskeletal 19-like [Rhinophrynus dorsalis]
MSFNSNNYWSSSSSTYLNGGLSQGKESFSSSSLHGRGGDAGSRYSVSKTRSFSSGSGGYDYMKDCGKSQLFNNDKETMQSLNERLASYLEKVRLLESDNAELERKIQDWHNKRTPSNKRDYSRYEKAISDLQSQLISGHLHGAKLTLQMENAKLASDAFKRKYDTEKAVRTTLEADLEGLRKVMDNLTIVRTDLELEVEGLRKQLIYMRMSHEETMKMAQGQKKGSSVNVELDAAPQEDLAKIIAKMRKEYEALIEKNRREAADWYNNQSSTVQQEVKSNTEALQSSRNQIKELNRNAQSLEIELQAELSKKYNLESILAETQASSAEQLQKIQSTICQLEAELSNVRNDLERQNNEYRILLDIKSRLETEIATYRQLLEGNNTRGTSGYSEGANRPVTKIVQEVINGRVVSTKTSELPKKL